MTFPTGIDFATALGIVREVGARHRTQVAPLGLREARGHALAQSLAAPIALPPFDNSAMDGFAVRAADLRDDGETRLRLVGTQFASVDLEHLQAELQGILDLDVDSLYFFRQCGACWPAVQCFGQAEPPRRELFWEAW